MVPPSLHPATPAVPHPPCGTPEHRDQGRGQRAAGQGSLRQRGARDGGAGRGAGGRGRAAVERGRTRRHAARALPHPGQPHCPPATASGDTTVHRYTKRKQQPRTNPMLTRRRGDARWFKCPCPQRSCAWMYRYLRNHLASLCARTPYAEHLGIIDFRRCSPQLRCLSYNCVDLRTLFVAS